MAASKEDNDDTAHSDVGSQLRAAAQRLGLSDRQLAARAGLPHPTVAKAFRGGNITLTSFRRLVEALGLTVIDFGRFKAAVDTPDIEATRAAFADISDLERRVAATRASLGKTLEQRERDEKTLDLSREVAREAIRRK
jgi:transcriptional regulator with XRE-family HTH domain